MTDDNQILRLPVGCAMWACVLKPRVRNRGTPNEYTAWTMSLQYEQGDAEAQRLIQYFGELFRSSHPQASPGRGSLPFTVPVDPMTQQPLGLWQIGFTRRTTWPDGSPQAPPVVEDAGGNPWPADLQIGNGSLVRVACSWWIKRGSAERPPGIGLDLLGVRVLNHVPYTPTGPSAVPLANVFGGPEQGFRLPAQPTPHAGAPVGAGTGVFGPAGPLPNGQAAPAPGQPRGAGPAGWAPPANGQPPSVLAQLRGETPQDWGPASNEEVPF